MANLGFGANPYMDQYVQDAQDDTVRGYNMVTAPTLSSAMVRSGSFGNSGVQQMQDQAASQLQKNLGSQANNLRSQDFWTGQGFNRQLYNDAAGYQQQNFGNSLNLLGLGNQAASQNLGFGTQIQNTPMGYFNNFAQQAGSLGQGYGTSTGTSSAQGSPLMGALGGYQLGGQIGKNWGTNYGGSAGGNSMFPDYGSASGATGGWV